MDIVDIEKVNRKNFRALLQALSQPGKVEKIAPLFDSSFLAIANCLLFSEVSFFYKGRENFELIQAISNLKQEEITKADYIFCDNVDIQIFQNGKIGTPLEPEFSSTFIFKCEDFDGLNVKISGAGINGDKKISLPVDRDFVLNFNEKNTNFPLGNEVFFLNQKNEIISLSRTTRVEVL